jgi:hypothetical protein
MCPNSHLTGLLVGTSKPCPAPLTGKAGIGAAFRMDWEKVEANWVAAWWLECITLDGRAPALDLCRELSAPH